MLSHVTSLFPVYCLVFPLYFTRIDTYSQTIYRYSITILNIRVSSIYYFATFYNMENTSDNRISLFNSFLNAIKHAFPSHNAEYINRTHSFPPSEFHLSPEALPLIAYLSTSLFSHNHPPLPVDISTNLFKASLLSHQPILAQQLLSFLQNPQLPITPITNEHVQESQPPPDTPLPPLLTNTEQFLVDAFNRPFFKKQFSEPLKPTSIKSYKYSIQKLFLDQELFTPDFFSLPLPILLQRFSPDISLFLKNPKLYTLHDNIITALKAILRNTSNDHVFIQTYFSHPHFHKQFLHYMDQVHTQLCSYKDELQFNNSQGLSLHEKQFLLPWTSLQNLTHEFLLPILSKPLQESTTITIQSAVIASLYTIDHPPRRNEILFLQSLQHLPPNSPTQSINFYNPITQTIHLNNYKTLHKFGPYQFIVSDNTHILLQELIQRKPHNDHPFIFLPHGEPNKINSTLVLQQFFTTVFRSPQTSRLLRVSCISHHKASGQLNYLHEQKLLSLQMAHSVDMQNTTYTRRLPSSHTDQPSHTQDISNLPEEISLITTNDIPQTDHTYTPEVSPTNKSTCPIQETSPISSSEQEQDTNLPPTTRPRKQKQPYPPQAIDDLNTLLQQAHTNLPPDYTKSQLLHQLFSLLSTKPPQWFNLIQPSQQDIQIKTQNEKVKRINNHSDLQWFSIVPLTPSDIKRLHTPLLPHHNTPPTP